MIEIREFFRHVRRLHFIPLLILGVFFVSWIYPVGSPGMAIVIIVIGGLELQFNNILFRTSNEWEVMSMFPIAWKNVVLAKNLATIVLFFILFILCAMALFYFLPANIKTEHLVDVGVYLWTVIFPLLIIGNTQSVRRPRRTSGLQLNDLMEIFWMLSNLGVVSIPFIIFTTVAYRPALSVVYGMATILYWYRISIPRTSVRIEKEHITLCSQ